MLTNFGLYLDIVNITLWRLCNLLHFLKSVDIYRSADTHEETVQDCRKEHRKAQGIVPVTHTGLKIILSPISQNKKPYNSWDRDYSTQNRLA